MQTDLHLFELKSRRNEMKTIFAAIALGLFSVTVLAEPRMDTDVSPFGQAVENAADEEHLEEHGC